VTFGPIERAAWTAGGRRLGTLETVTDPRQQASAGLDLRGRAAVEALSDAIGGIAGVLTVDAVLQLIVDRVRHLVGARYAALGILADDRRRIERFITSGITPEQRRLLGDPPQGHGLLGLIIQEGRSLRIPDIGAHPASYGFPAHHPPMTSLLGVPVRLKNRTIGNLYLTDKIDAAEFSDDDQRLVELFAAHAGIAIENARLHEAVQYLAVVDERERIGKDLHDGIIQTLYAISLSLEDVPDLMDQDVAEASATVDRAIDTLNRAIADLRQFVVGLRPEAIDQADFNGLLAALVDQVRQNNVVEVELELPHERIELPAHARSELLQIAREALSNIARHAHATTARITVRLDDDRLRLEVADDGIGFDASSTVPRGHLGLANMRDRAGALGGALEMGSGTPGTTIIVTVPLPETVVAQGASEEGSGDIA
jgi:signal transduction histidine kinase